MSSGRVDNSAFARWFGGSAAQMLAITVALSALDIADPFLRNVSPLLAQAVAVLFFATMSIRSRIFSVSSFSLGRVFRAPRARSYLGLVLLRSASEVSLPIFLLHVNISIFELIMHAPVQASSSPHHSLISTTLKTCGFVGIMCVRVHAHGHWY